MVKITDEMIREAAYYIWEKEGHGNGGDFDHWIRAKSELAALEKKEAKADKECKTCKTTKKATKKRKASKKKASTKAKSPAKSKAKK
jgi:hypothetical protein